MSSLPPKKRKATPEKPKEKPLLQIELTNSNAVGSAPTMEDLTVKNKEDIIFAEYGDISPGTRSVVATT